MAGNRVGLISESADVLYHLLVTWVHAGIRPEEVWQELQHRERVSHLTEGTDVPLKRLWAACRSGRARSHEFLNEQEAMWPTAALWLFCTKSMRH